MKHVKGAERTFRILTSAFMLVTSLSVGGLVVTDEWSGYINKMMGLSDTKVVDDENAEDKDTTYFKSEFKTYQETMAHAREVAKKVEGEGAVLLRNENNALPLAMGSKVSYLSYSSVDVALGGTGSGGITVSEDRKTDLIKASKNENKLVPNETLYSFYKGKLDEGYEAKNGAISRKLGGGWGATATPVSFQAPEIKPTDFSDDAKNSLNEFNDAGIFVLTRIGGEGNDLRKTNATDTEAGNYLALTDDEKAVLQMMKDGNFKKRVLLLNTFNTFELDFLEEYNIDAVLYIGGTGEIGLDAVTDILVGKINPSGKTADTYVKSNFSAPAMQNFGEFEFSNSADIANADSKKYLMYNEGIYVGYRYYETRYEDTITNSGKANSNVGSINGTNWNYDNEVVYPFGHGLSYSTFSENLKSVKVNENGKTVDIEVEVTNDSEIAGKDVVEIYAQAPYTAGGVEKSAVQLVGFAKTGMLAAHAKEVVKITVDLNDLASYDSEGEQTYILDKGKYYFAVGNDVHDALNNIMTKKGVITTGDSAKAYEWEKTSFNKEEYMLSKTMKKVTNQFETADIHYFDETIKTLSRSDWEGTWPVAQNSYAANEKMKNDISGFYPTEAGGVPSSYTVDSSSISDIVVGSTATQYNLAMMRGASYDDPAWDDLVSQMTFDELAEMTKQGRSQIASVGLPSTTAVDGPAAWTKSTYKEDYLDVSADAKKTSENMVSYPTETVVAGTWNLALLEELGDSFGEEGLWGGGVGWYGPACNIHRTAYGGRNFEYFSEDGFISGKYAEAEVHGAMKKGVIPYLKHCFLNDQETNRIGVCTFANEQTIREIYLRAFQYSFETTGEDDPSCSGVMGAFDRLGVTWTGHYGNLWKNVMEDEWGFLGNVTTDFGQKPQSLMEPYLAYENGTTMFCTSGKTFADIVLPNCKNDRRLLLNMQSAAKRNLYNFANSLAMNGISSTSKIVHVNTWYTNALISLTAVGAAGAFVCAAGVATLTLIGRKHKED